MNGVHVAVALVALVWLALDVVARRSAGLPAAVGARGIAGIAALAVVVIGALTARHLWWVGGGVAVALGTAGLVALVVAVPHTDR